VALVGALVLGACTASPPPLSVTPVARVAILHDASIPDARSIVTPSVLAAEFALREAGLDPWVLDVSVDPAGAARAVGADDRTVAAIVAPFTASASTGTALVDTGVPVVALSQDATPTGVLRMVPSVEHGLQTVLGLIGDEPACLLSGTDPWAVTTAEGLAAADAALSRPPTAEGCHTVVWSGPAAGAAALRIDPRRSLILTDQARTQGFILAVGPDAGATAGVCGCVDPGSSAGAALQSFVHAYQEETGLDPGPYAAEAYDAATVVAEAARGGGRAAVAEALGALRSFTGAAGTYRWDARGDLIRPGIRTYLAEGVRWLPI
jgi:hypothetical protein